jgi:hypothetical protein
MKRTTLALLILSPLVWACNGSKTNTTGATAPAASEPPTRPAQSTPAEPKLAAIDSPPATAPSYSWSFDDGALDTAPQGFSFARTGSGRQGRWLVRAEPSAPSPPNVLAQLDDDKTSFRFPLAVANQPRLVDVRVSARCKMISGRVDQACGLVARYRDESNYFVTRANALENNIRLYTVRDGKRDELASWSGTVTPHAWHEYRLELRGDHLEVFWDGQKVLDHHDSTFPDAGQVGVWTKADSVTYFDDLRAEPL